MARQTNSKGSVGSGSLKSVLNQAPNNRFTLGSDAVAGRDNAIVLGKPGTSTVPSVFVGVGTNNPVAMLSVTGSLFANDYKNSAGTAIPGIFSVRDSSTNDLFTVSPTTAQFNAATVNMNPSGTQVATFTTSGLKLVNTTTGYVPTGLRNYMEGSFTASFTGAATLSSLTIYYTWVGNKVTLKIPAVPTTSETSAAVLTATGAISIAALCPTTALYFPILLTDNGSATTGRLQITSTGNIIIGVGAGGTAFAGISTLSWQPLEVTYHIAAVP